MAKPWAPRLWRERFCHRLPWNADGPVPVRGPSDPYPAGTACCWLHEPIPAAPTDHQWEDPNMLVQWEHGPDACTFCLRPRAEHAPVPLSREANGST